MKNNFIHYSAPTITQADIKAVNKVLKSDYLTTGPNTKLFEDKISKFVNSKYAVAVNSATSGLHLACIALGVKKNDHVWVSSNSFIASANAAAHLDAKITFLDINLSTYNLDIEYLKKKLLYSKNIPKLLIIVDFAGHPCDLKEIYELSKKFKFKILQDSSHALGAHYNKFRIGDCKFSDVTVFSFHPVKTITTGEGGVITTNNNKIYQSLMSLRNHGIIRDKKFLSKKNMPLWYYEQNELGFNYRISDIHAALGVSQLRNIKKYIKIRNHIAKKYNTLFKNLPIFLPKKKSDVTSTYHLYVIRLKNQKLRDKIYKNLSKNNIGTNLHYIPIYKQPFYKKKLNKNFNLPNSEEYYKTALSLPIHPKLSLKNINKIVSIIKSSLKT